MPGNRSRTRALLIQALYQAELTGHDQYELAGQFSQRQEYARVDAGLFRDLLAEVFANRQQIDALIRRFADRPVNQIDPVERAVLSIGIQELLAHRETPYRVVINEAVSLAKRFGAEDGHKYVNALLDKIAAEHRRAEYEAARG